MFCPICQFPPHPLNYMLTGICQESSIDRYYFSTSYNSDGFYGYIHSKMLFSYESWRWEILDFDNQILAYMANFDQEALLGMV